MSIYDGGPAFPCPDTENYDGEAGMSLRDWFAGLAMQGMLASGQVVLNVPGEAYEFADLMLKAKKEVKK